MLNRLLSRQGLEIGAIVSYGQEDYLELERGIQTFLGYSYADRLHVATHHHNPPLVPRERMLGVRGRIDVFGEEVLPLREEDAREAAAALLDAGVQGIVVSLLFSYRNAEHEIRVGEILAEEKEKRGSNGDVPVFLSSELYPMRRDLPRLNSTLIEAYAAEPSRGTLQKVRDQTKRGGRRLRAAGDGRRTAGPSRSRPRSWRGRWSPGRSAASSAAPRWPSASTSATCCAPTSAAPRSTSR